MADKRPITFLKQQDPLNYLITLFSRLDDETNDKALVEVEGGYAFVEKEPTPLDINYEPLKFKVLDWMGNQTSMTPLDLNQEESDLIRKCSHAVYYLVTEDSYPKEKRPEKFILYHEHLFKNKKSD